MPKITGLPSTVTLGDNDALVVVENGVTKQAKYSDVLPSVQTVVDSAAAYVQAADDALENNEKTVNDFVAAGASGYPVLNMLASSRGVVDTRSEQIGVFAAFTAYLEGFNGAVISEGDKFVYDSSTYGGGGAALAQSVQDLMDKMQRSTTAKRYNAEFYTGVMTAGASLTFESPTRSGHYLLTVNDSAIRNRASSYGMWVKLVSGGLSINSNKVFVDGVLKALPEILVGDGWVYINIDDFAVMDDATSYFNLSPNLYAAANSVIEFALPSLFLRRATSEVIKTPTSVMGVNL